MFENIGERICYCRSLIGMTQREFAAHFGISKPTITRWELGTVKIPLNKIAKLVSFFNEMKLIVELEWLLSGKGSKPVISDYHSLEKLNFDELSYSTLDGLKLQIPGFVVYQIHSDFMTPILEIGDYIGGVFEKNIETCCNKLSFCINNQNFYVGLFDFVSFSLYNLKAEKIYLKKENCTLGKVLWITKRH